MGKQSGGHVDCKEGYSSIWDYLYLFVTIAQLFYTSEQFPLVS
jgi:hypothetical protein